MILNEHARKCSSSSLPNAILLLSIFALPIPWGVRHHLTTPAESVDEDRLEAGIAFDGSSLPGWKNIEASDMLLLPDCSTLRMDPFREEPTVVITCDVIEPNDLKGYARDPSLYREAPKPICSQQGWAIPLILAPSPNSRV